MRQPSRTLCCLLIIALVNVCAAGISTNRFVIVHRPYEHEYLQSSEKGLVSGEDTFDKGANKDEKDRWYIDAGKIKNSVTGQYLAYDRSGKNLEPFLVDKPGPGTVWKIQSIEKEDRVSEIGSLRATEGEVADWYLAMEKGKFVLSKKDSGVTIERIFYGK